MLYEMCGEDVDVEFVDFYIWVLFCYFGYMFVLVGYGDCDVIVFGGVG